MSWKEDMRQYWERYDAYERRRATTAIDDVPMNMSDLTDFVISSYYSQFKKQHSIQCLQVMLFTILLVN